MFTPEEIVFLTSHGKIAAAVIFIATWGRLAEIYANNRMAGKSRSEKIAYAVQQCLFASFAGMMMFVGTRLMKWPDLAAAGLSGAAGWMGPAQVDQAIRETVSHVKRRFGIQDAADN